MKRARLSDPTGPPRSSVFALPVGEPERQEPAESDGTLLDRLALWLADVSAEVALATRLQSATADEEPAA